MKLRIWYLLISLFLFALGGFLLWLPFVTHALGWIVFALCLVGFAVCLGALSALANAFRPRPPRDLGEGILDIIFSFITWF